MSYKFEVLDCPICGRPIADNRYVRHMKKAHGAGDLTETEVESIKAQVSRDGHYSWADFQYEQHEDF